MATNRSLALVLAVELCALAVGQPTRALRAEQAKQDAGPPTGRIAGQVVESLSNVPVEGAVVSLLAGPARQLSRDYRQLTDAAGRFVFDALPLGEYSLVASKAGFLLAHQGVSTVERPNGATIALTPALPSADIRLRITRYATVAGRVTDATGAPLAGAYVRAIERIGLAGRTTVAAGPAVFTDDRGEYEIPGLTPGDYYLTTQFVRPDKGQAGSSLVHYLFAPPDHDGHEQVYLSAFYPQASSLAEAQLIRVGPSTAQDGVNLTILTGRAHQVAGRVSGPDVAGGTLRLVPSGLEALGRGAEIATATVGADGRFEFAAVPSGTYRLLATPALVGYQQFDRLILGAPVPWLAPVRSLTGSFGTSVGAPDTQVTFVAPARNEPWGDQTVVVEDADVDVTLNVHASSVIEARVDWDGSPRFSVQNGVAIASLADTRLASSDSVGTLAAGTLRVEGLRPGSYFLTLPYGVLRSLVCEGRDVTRTGVPVDEGVSPMHCVVTLASAPGGIEGKVVAGANPTDQAVIAFPAVGYDRPETSLRPDDWKLVGVDAAGAYRVTDLPAGDFVVAAISASDVGRRFDADFLAAVVARGRQAHVNWGQVTQVNLGASGAVGR